MTTVIGHEREPALERRVAGELLQEERRGRSVSVESAGVDGERLEVREGEVAPAEEAQRQHRVRRAGAPRATNSPKQRDPADERDEDQRVAEAALRRLDQREDRPGEAEHAEHAADDVDARARSPVASRRGSATTISAERDDRERHVDRGRSSATTPTETSQPPTSGPITNAIPVHAVQRADRRAALLAAERRR